jgi:hypothetical protein
MRWEEGGIEEWFYVVKACSSANCWCGRHLLQMMCFREFRNGETSRHLFKMPIDVPIGLIRLQYSPLLRTTPSASTIVRL